MKTDSLLMDRLSFVIITAMSRGDQALRQWKILTILMNHAQYGVTQKEILDEIGESAPRGTGRRTFQRDLQVLEQADFPIDRTERNQEGQVLYKLLPTFQLVPPIMPAANELIALSNQYHTQKTKKAV